MFEISDTHEMEVQPTILDRDVANNLKIGILFSTEKEAYDYYNAYAIDKGFSVHKDILRRNKNEKIIGRTYVQKQVDHMPNLKIV